MSSAGLRGLTFGAGLASLQAGAGQSQAEVYGEAVEVAAAVERLGMDGIWAPEHHLSVDGYMPSPLIYLAAVSGATRSIRLGTSIAIAPLYHPVRLAEDAATLQLLSSGRLTLGLGLGWRCAERELYGVIDKPSGMDLEQSIAALRKYGSGDVVHPRPEPTIPLLIGGVTDSGAARAGRVADGLVLVRDKADRMRRRIGIMREAAVKAGRDPDGLEVVTIVSAHISQGDAWAEVREAATASTAGYNALRVDEKAPDGLPAHEESVRRNLICGTPSEVVPHFQRVVDACREAARHHMIISNMWAGLPSEQVLSSFSLFCDRVAPALSWS